jgi:hypothetical protein
VLKLEWLELRVDASLERLEVALQLPELPELHGQQKALVLAHPALQGRLEFGVLAPHPSSRQAGHLGSTGPAGGQGLQHGHTRDADDVAGDTAPERQPDVE